MAEKQYYPAIFASSFESAQAALAKLGIAGTDADFCLAGVEIGRDRPVVFEIVIRDPGANLSGQPAAKSTVVLMEREDGSIGLWFGMFNHLRSDPDEALAALVDELLISDPQDPPTVKIFEWSHPMRTLQ
jgi:hypothetical protein